MESTKLKVGELAKQTGISVRSLHYYDEIGLLSPSHRTEAGYRLYTKTDVMRLQQIVSLRQIGLSLKQIQTCLAQSQFSPHDVVKLHLTKLKQHIEEQQALYQKLSAIADRLQVTEAISIDEFIQLIEKTTMLNKYYTPEQLDYLKARREQIGEEAILQAQADWQDLMAQARTAQAQGIAPANPSVQALAKRWMELIQAFTGNNAGVEQSLNQMYQQEGPAAASQGAFTEGDALSEYMGKAIEILKQKNEEK
ncbi:MAG: MerR family transcriptional regulator [Cyanobacteria bacterium P01_F01_bin.53]